jgi:RNA polymerase sigma factor (sigma-70 family)
MKTGQPHSLTRFVRQLGRATAVAGSSDEELLGHFVRRADDAAFTAIVRRHGPMVLGICRRVLHHEQDAEDAFQATFLILARKSGSLRRAASLGPWLHGVALRTAAKARVGVERRRAAVYVGKEIAAAPAGDEVLGRDLRFVIDDAIDRLPEKYRVPFVLCHLEGMSGAEVARRLGCPPGTVASRLSRARERLRCHLAKRGLTVPVALFATALTAGTASAALPASLVQMTAEAATMGIVSPQVAALVEAMSRALFLARWKGVTAVLLALTLLAGGLATASVPAAQEGPPTEPGLTLRVPHEDPSAALLVAYLNGNARRVKTLECPDAFIERYYGDFDRVGLMAYLAYRSPRDCRLLGEVLGNDELDLGCNDRECWCWLKRREPSVQLASQKDLAQGKGKWSLPFRVEWLASALSIAEYDTTARYEVVARPDAFELVDRLTAPDGKVLRRVTVIGRKPAAWQVTGYRLEDDKGKAVCTVTVSECRQDKDSGAVVPHRLQIEWPSMKTRLKLDLGRVRLNGPIGGERGNHLFQVPNHLRR